MKKGGHEEDIYALLGSSVSKFGGDILGMVGDDDVPLPPSLSNMKPYWKETYVSESPMVSEELNLIPQYQNPNLTKLGPNVPQYQSPSFSSQNPIGFDPFEDEDFLKTIIGLQRRD